MQLQQSLKGSDSLRDCVLGRYIAAITQFGIVHNSNSSPSSTAAKSKMARFPQGLCTWRIFNCNYLILNSIYLQLFPSSKSDIDLQNWLLVQFWLWLFGMTKFLTGAANFLSCQIFLLQQLLNVLVIPKMML